MGSNAIHFHSQPLPGHKVLRRGPASGQTFACSAVIDYQGHRAREYRFPEYINNLSPRPVRNVVRVSSFQAKLSPCADQVDPYGRCGTRGAGVEVQIHCYSRSIMGDSLKISLKLLLHLHELVDVG